MKFLGEEEPVDPPDSQDEWGRMSTWGKVLNWAAAVAFALLVLYVVRMCVN